MFYPRLTKDGFNFYLKIFNMVAKFDFYHTFVRTMGMTNTVTHLKDYVLFLDIDDMTRKQVISLLHKLHKFIRNLNDAFIGVPRGLGTCVLLKTRNDGKHWHVIDPSIYSLWEMINLLYAYSPNDIKYLSCGLRQCGPKTGGWTLRIDRKDGRDEQIEFDSFVYMVNPPVRPVSGAHIDFLEAMHGIDYPLEKSVHLVPTSLEVDKYYTTNVVKR